MRAALFNLTLACVAIGLVLYWFGDLVDVKIAGVGAILAGTAVVALAFQLRRKG